MSAVNQDSNDEWRYLKGSAKVETTEMVITADEIDYNSDTHWAYARGHVHLEQFSTSDKLNADHAEYNLETEEGKFYTVDGTVPAKIVSSPSVLTTTNPFYFKADWAERIKNRYILHKGFVTDCKYPKPWWTFQAPEFDIIPGNRAIGRHTLFRLKRIPILYLPYFYRPLGRNPRQSGFLTPNFGHSSIYGYIYGLGYYWAINRSYDMTGVVQYFTTRGPAVTYDFRGKPNEVTDYNFSLYGVDDKGIPQGNGTVEKQGGVEFEVTARTQIMGFNGRLDYNYLSSYLFRQAFSYSFYSAILSQVTSVGYLQRRFHDDRYTFTIAFSRDQLFESTTLLDQTPNQVIIQKLPSFQFSGRDQRLTSDSLPVWFSFDSSAALLTRSAPTGFINASGGVPSQIFNSGAVGRIDLEPRVSTAFNFAGFSLSPSVTFGATDYSNSFSQNTTTYGPIVPCGGYSGCPPNAVNTVALANASYFRNDADVTVDLRLPTLERIYTPPKWLHLGTKLKHTIEVGAEYEYLTGINAFQKILLFDTTDILSNTNQLTYSMTNRLYRKDKNGNVNEVLTWRLAQAQYFDPTFGGAVLPNVRNVVLATEELTPYTFLGGPRTYSPVVSTLIFSPYSFLNVEWRADYDPFYRRITENTYSVGVRRGKYFANVGDNSINTSPLLLPQANQITFGGGYGNTNRKGWNAAGLVDYDLLVHKTLYEFIQASYNTDCCGFSIQLRRINVGIRDENQYLFSFSVANIGSFGSLQRQERIQ
ncbi:MAG: LPS-assembly protein LptD [Acidobacteriaceae bacterium]|nr:LPS-assembly protein LptD [Acidobacteriaceae bacterium]